MLFNKFTNFTGKKFSVIRMRNVQGIVFIAMNTNI